MIIGVGGCVAQQYGSEIIKRVPHVDFVFGTHNLSLIPEFIKDADEKYLNGDGNSKYNLLNKSVKNHRITDNDWNIYVSVYDYLFNTKNGVYYIERNSLKTNGITENYFITDAIFGTLNSTSDLNYMVCEYDQKR